MATPTSVLPVTFRSILIETLKAESFGTESEQAFLEVITEIKDNVRIYFLSEEIIASKIWKPFRLKEEALDYLMRLSMTFHFKIHEYDLEESFNHSIKAMLMSVKDQKGVFMDEDFAQKTHYTTDGFEYYPGWLTFTLYCLTDMKTVLMILAKSS